MTVKFIQYCDVLSEHREEFGDFLSKNYIPGINDTGLLKILGSWYAVSGEGPFHILEGVADSMAQVHALLEQEEFIKLNRLMHFVSTNYRTKILVPTGRVESLLPEHTNFRFNHHYDVITDRYDTYEAFMENEYIPALEGLGIKMIGSWYVAIGPGPNIVTEGSCTDPKRILEAIGSETYRRLTAKLLPMVNGFGSKILMPSGLLP
ncbi:MAG: hypothetical protein JRH13_00340 [Deltaproteobacteria bacterium]|nr:hypothetical protein [Deltaproteobacteria bacterium]MBW2015266.1 hypothetical protein [Deltaproteobacteria bacterium]MBW2127798.1 hypothetical protein [Deltaproteobacteria bacterium]MBW2302082.1 hypothetical protein [Deltaproteobacteria bacterium]